MLSLLKTVIMMPFAPGATPLRMALSPIAIPMTCVPWVQVEHFGIELAAPDPNWVAWPLGQSEMVFDGA